MSTGKVTTFSTGTIGVDKTGAIISSSAAKQLYSLGYRFALRDIGVPTKPDPGQLNANEVTGLLGAGMAVSVFQLNWQQTSFTSSQGTADGQYLVNQVMACGIPRSPTLTLWFDLEGGMGGNATNLLAYINAWAAAVVDGGFAAGMYTGTNPGGSSPLSQQQISNLANVHAYWQAAMLLPYSMPARGYQIYQLYPQSLTIAGIPVDVDVLQSDFYKSSPTFWGPSASAAV